MRTTVRLDDALFEQAKAEAERRGTTFTALLEVSLKGELQRSRLTPRKVKLPVSDTSGGPWPGIDLNNSAQLWAILDGPDDPTRR
jgi:hypothetical protein